LEVKICSKSFFFSKEQILLFSSGAFLYVIETKQSFNIVTPPNISEKLLLSCFQEIFSLFSSISEIKISPIMLFPFIIYQEYLKIQAFL
jgi:hypothetical protein